MGSLKVRGLDDGVIERLKRRAAQNGRSMEGEARHILEQAVEDDMAAKGKAFLDLVRPLREGAATGPQTPGWALIREDRDRDHRLV